MRSGKNDRQWLSPEELEQLTQTWEIWAQNVTSPTRAIARSRLHLFFLLARYAGLRSTEIHNFSADMLDRQTGLLQLKDRSIFLSPRAMRPLRRILALQQANEDGFLHLDAGFVRRTFYELGRLAGLPPEACAPRALRNARGRELLAMHMPAHIVAANLGLSSPLHINQFDKQDTGSDRTNRFTAVLAAMQTDYRSGRLFLETDAGFKLVAISPLQELANLEPAVGKPLSIYIPPAFIFPSQTPLPMANRLKCSVLSVTADNVEIRLRLKTEQGQTLIVFTDAMVNSEWISTKSKLIVYIPAHAIKLEK